MPSTFRAAGINTAAVYKEQRIPVYVSARLRPLRPAGIPSPGVRDIRVRGNGRIRCARIPSGSTGSHRMRRVPRPGKGRQVATYDQLTSWAGPEGVTRLRREDVAGWRIPDAAKVRLVETGTPVAPRLVERVTTQREAVPSLLSSGGPLHRRPSGRTPTPRPSGPRSVSHRGPLGPLRPAGRRDALCQLGDRPAAGHPPPLRHPRHHLGEPDSPEEYLSLAEEQRALAELGRPPEELREIDAATFGGYERYLWPELLDRWLF